MSADERREQVIKAAMAEFARRGYEGTSTVVIADRVGVSQPYLFRLFPNKNALFLAAAERCFDDLEQAMRDAAGGLYGTEAITAMGAAYRALLTDGPTLQLQLQIYAAALEDEAVRERGHLRLAKLWRLVGELSGQGPTEVMRFVSVGMLLNVLTSFDVPYTPGPEALPNSLFKWASDTRE